MCLPFRSPCRDTIHFPFGSGSLDASADFSIDAVIALTVSGNSFSIHEQSMSLNLGNIDVNIHGSLFDWLYQLLVSMFKSVLTSTVHDEVPASDRLHTQMYIQMYIQSSVIGTYPDTHSPHLSSPFSSSQVSQELTEFINDDANALLQTVSMVFPLPVPSPFNILTADLTPVSTCTLADIETVYAKGQIYAGSKP